MREWVLDYFIQYPTFQLTLFILVTDTYQKIYIPGKFITRLLFYSKNSHILINLTDFSLGTFGQREISPQAMPIHKNKNLQTKLHIMRVIFIHKIDTNTPTVLEQWVSEFLVEDKSAAKNVANKVKMSKFTFIWKGP